VEAFTAMPDKRLVVIGTGPELEKARSVAGPNVTLMGYQSFAVLKSHMQRAKAFVFAAEEDFGITPVEAQACGTPVIAFGKGGALETVIEPSKGEKPTGVFFHHQSVEAIQEAVRVFEASSDKFFGENCVDNSKRFSEEIFRSNLLKIAAQSL
jgi:glycosyltransferase involved in cell wall biosynthesis